MEADVARLAGELAALDELGGRSQAPRAAPAREAPPAHTGGGAAPRLRLRVSPRYARVSGRLLGLHRSSTFRAKRRAGAYAASEGRFRQRGYREALQAPPAAAPGEAEREDQAWRTLLAWDRGEQHPVEYATRAGGPGARLRVRLWGPREALDRWSSWCEWGEAHVFGGTLRGASPTEPYPVLVPSKGRADSAHLNWQAAHCFGERPEAPRPAPRGPSVVRSPAPLVVAVVEPSESAAYRRRWPGLLLMVLPEGGLGPSFARWAAQRVCSAMREERPGGDLEALQRLPCCWLCDDNVMCFYRMEALPGAGPGRSGGAKRRRCAGGPMFAEAFRAVQAQAAASNSAVSGFLRDDGTASDKGRAWTTRSSSVFKVVLLNLVELARLRVEYVWQLQVFEDVCLNTQVRDRGGQLLKSMTYCYRAAADAKGGCEAIRAKRAASQRLTRIEDLLPATALEALPEPARAAVLQVHRWVSLGEARSQRLEQRRGEPTPAAVAGRRPGGVAAASASAAADPAAPAAGAAKTGARRRGGAGAMAAKAATAMDKAPGRGGSHTAQPPPCDRGRRGPASPLLQALRARLAMRRGHGQAAAEAAVAAEAAAAAEAVAVEAAVAAEAEEAAPEVVAAAEAAAAADAEEAAEATEAAVAVDTAAAAVEVSDDEATEAAAAEVAAAEATEAAAAEAAAAEVAAAEVAVAAKIAAAAAKEAATEAPCTERLLDLLAASGADPLVALPSPGAGSATVPGHGQGPAGRSGARPVWRRPLAGGGGARLALDLE